MGCIYLVTNKINAKQYVGQTIRKMYDRKSDHHLQAKNNCDSMPFHRAIRKYGKNGFEWQLLADGIDDISELNKLEKQYIAQYNTLVPNGYNLQQGGWNGYHHEETKRKMSMAHKGKIMENSAIRSIALIIGDVRQRIDHGHCGNATQRDSMRMGNGEKRRARRITFGRIIKLKRLNTGYVELKHNHHVEANKRINQNQAYRDMMRNKWELMRSRPNSKPIRCIETKEEYVSIGDMVNKIGIDRKGAKEIIGQPSRTYKQRHYVYISPV
jgi:group I intron endonuclease